MHFMAIEVESQGYLFPLDNTNSIIELLMIYNNVLSSTTKGSSSGSLFHMNFLHNLESLWWATLWLLLYYTSKDCPTEDLEGQQQSFDNAFLSSIALASHLAFFNTNTKEF